MAQIGYKSRARRGTTAAGSEIPSCRKIDPPVPTRAKIDVTHLQSPNFTKEYVPGFADLPEVTYECLSVNGDTVQNGIEADFYNGVVTPEAWSHSICDPVTAAVQRSYDYNGYLASVSRGPIETEVAILLSIKVQLTGAVTIS
jgi:hypothetical protein